MASSLSFMWVALSCCLAVLGLCGLPQVAGQDWLPQVAPLTSCSVGSLVSFGNATLNATTLGGLNDGQGNNYGYLYSEYSPFYFFTNAQFGVTISQLSIGLPDNGNVNYPGVVHFRLGLFEVFGASGAVSLLGQTDEITFYYTGGAHLIAANLQVPVLLEGGTFGITIMADQELYINGMNTPSTPNTAIVYYSPYGIPQGLQLGYTAPTPFMQATGCVSTAGSPYLASQHGVLRVLRLGSVLCPRLQQPRPHCRSADHHRCPGRRHRRQHRHDGHWVTGDLQQSHRGLWPLLRHHLLRTVLPGGTGQ